MREITCRHFREAVARVVKLHGSWRTRMKLGALRAFMCRSAADHEVCVSG